MARPTPYLLINRNVFAQLSVDFTAEEIGHAMKLLAWLARGRERATERQRANVCGLGLTAWSNRRAGIMGALKVLIENSEPRVRAGRPPISKARRQAILARDGAVCRYCGDTEGPFHVDHIKPLARGGSNRDQNLGVACAACNFAKAAKLVAEWL
jgi:hypothetical protein